MYVFFAIAQRCSPLLVNDQEHLSYANHEMLVSHRTLYLGGDHEHVSYDNRKMIVTRRILFSETNAVYVSAKSIMIQDIL